MDDFETWSNRLNVPWQLGWFWPDNTDLQWDHEWISPVNVLPSKLEWISNEDKFVNVYKDLKSRYNKNFDESDLRVIKETWDKWCKNYWTLNPTRIRILENRIDSGLFLLNYPEFAQLDLNYIIWTIKDANVQHKFRDIIIKLERNLGELYPNEISIVEKVIKKQISKKPSSWSPIFNEIYNDLLQEIKNGRSLTNNWEPNMEGHPNFLWESWLSFNIENGNINFWDLFNTWKTKPWRIPEWQIKSFMKMDIPENLVDVRNLLIWNISFENFHYYDNNWNKIWLSDDDKTYIKNYTIGIFNDFANQINGVCGWMIPENFFNEWNVLSIISDHINDIILWKEISSKNLVKEITTLLFLNDDVLIVNINAIKEKEQEVLKKIDYKEVEEIEISEQEWEEIRIAGNTQLTEDIKIHYKLYKYLSKQKEDLWELDEELENMLQELDEFFYHIKKRVLKEIDSWNWWINVSYEYSLSSVHTSAEYATWNIKDIRPAAIIENHEGIRDYVYGGVKNTPNVDVENISFSSLSNDYKEYLLKKLISRNRSDSYFMDSIKYLDRFGNIDKEKAAADNIDESSLENNRLKIERMILDLAKEEALAQWEKSKINDVYVRKSSMVCCFRAISKFFDTVNNNWENFASEFEIGDLNNDIKFDEATWIISMEWTIWANKNHIKLYYNTQTWTLEFDNFLAYDSQDNSFKIWKWNWKREKMNIKLPTMDEMERQAQSINFGLIDRLSVNTHQYERMVWLAMWESIWFNCFQWFMGVDIDVNRYFVEQFNEKNILKQDIINTIYSKFYNQDDINEKLDGCLTISEWNEPEQFKLIKLISDTIDNCWSSNSLLRFRNAINWLDDILTNNHELVRDDILLQYLFWDNLSNGSDITDNSRKIFEQENENIATSNSINKFATYQSDERHENSWDKTINYNVFFDLLSENKFGERVINIDCFETAMTAIRTSWKHLLDDEQGLLWKNYIVKRDAWVIPDFKKEEELKHIESKLDEAYE